MIRSVGTLRNGFTTGSAASAAAVAAFLHSGNPVELILPSGESLKIPVAATGDGWASVVKDGGDDPDVTTGLEIRVTLTPCRESSTPADYEERIGDLELLIRGGTGIGIVTRPGLAVPVGKYAVNPMPRKMIAENLYRVGCRGRFLLEIAAPEGRTVAGKTMNPTLGVKNGISILGYSGVVRPYSHAAYAVTIVLQLKSFAAEGGIRAALVTGNRSAAAIARDCPDIASEGIVRIGDFIYVAVRAASVCRIPTLVIGCMAGKLFKYACAEKNTHANRSRLSLGRLREFDLPPMDLPLESMDTMRELAHHLSQDQWHRVLRVVYDRAKAVLQEWAGNTTVILNLYEEDGRQIL